MSTTEKVIKPVKPNFLTFNTNYTGAPILSLYQNKTHYTGHYIKYINKFNELLETEPRMNKIYNLIMKKSFNSDIDYRVLLIMSGIKMFEQNTTVYQNASQIYNHELYWQSITDITDSANQLNNLKQKLFTSDKQFDDFKKKFIDSGLKEFGSGWLWISRNIPTNELDVFTTHDSKVPFNNENTEILGVIDLWEHAYYLDYPADRKKYLEGSFQTLNWKNFVK